jgi:undecaprenyl-diphosphatase
VAVLLYFWKTWLDLLTHAYSYGVRKEQSTDRKLLVAIIIGTIPALIFGMLLESTIQDNLRSPVVIAVALIAGSGVFYLAEKFAKQNKSMADMTYTNSFMVGLSQVVALIPGVSRSGITISTGLFQGYDRESAARFAFLLSTPVIFGAALYLVLKVLLLEPTPVDWDLFLVGAITSFVTGYRTCSICYCIIVCGYLISLKLSCLLHTYVTLSVRLSFVCLEGLYKRDSCSTYKTVKPLMHKVTLVPVAYQLLQD